MIRSRFVAVLLLAALSGVSAHAATATPRELAQTRALLAIEYMKFGNMRVALENAEQAIAFDPAYQDAYLAKALIYMQLGVSAEAEKAFLQALKIDPANPEVNNNYGLYLCGNNRFDEAQARFDRALSDPFYATPQSAMINRAQCFVRMGQNDRANEWLLAALRRSPNDAQALRELFSLAVQNRNAALAGMYFDRLKLDENRMQAADLWLVIRFARLKQDRSLELRLAALLKKKYPDTREAQLLLTGN